MELSLQRREREVEELRAKVVQLNDRNRESYQEALDLCFELGRNRFSGRNGSGSSERRR